MIVVDASALVPALVDDGPSGDVARHRMRSVPLAAPDVIDLEVASTLRGLTIARKLSVRRAAAALDDLQALPVDRASHRALIARCWELRANLTAYDAAYVALAEMLKVPLVTADARIGRAPGLRCEVEVLAA